ncbi:ATP-binding protein [Sphingobacterium humi]|uniref:histidine kinase n=1 Tax=Sphingobacterium humi TaxID=1796905 RepID=A0A6N8KV29_9SPHI|nr:ATP-binding protein [Sphingobacterium humi]MVZ61320.1 response regulator [Sphingobacterium humi]
MLEKSEQTTERTKRNKTIRNILLVSTIVLFVAFLIFFISSFIQYKSIQNRIEKIYSTINTDQTSFIVLLTKFNDAENSFRKFSISYDSTDYISYKAQLTDLKNSVDSLRKVREIEEIIDNKNSNDSISYANLLPRYHELMEKIDSMLVTSSSLNNFHQESLNNSLFNLPSNQSRETINKTMQDGKIVLKRKPLLKRIFQSKLDTISFQDFDISRNTQTEIHADYSKMLQESNRRAQEKLDELKEVLAELRMNERSLLADNFTLLHTTNQLIRYIHDQRLKFQRDKSDRELSTLIANTDTFKWQIIISLTFVFIVICILVYYQFFTNYYEQMLMDEKMYASKLAEQKTDILAEITHEIRTPINSLIGIVDLLKSRNDLYQAKDVILLETAYSNLTSTSKTINDILNLSKIDKHDAVESQHFDYHDMLLEIIDNYRNQANLKNIQLHYVLDTDKPTILYTDELKVRQIISNLISNAIKYSAQGTVTAKIFVNNQSNLIIKISDEGNGIPEHLKKNIFKKYFTENKTNKVEGGVGLGLYITKNIVSLLKGKIYFQSKQNQGTTFTVEIPIPRPKFRRKNTLNIHKVKDLPKNLAWLIVDDNALNLLYLKQFFMLHEQVYTATNGIEALQILEEKTIDVVVTDINMPLMTGDELLVNIRQNAKTKQVKVIATSSDNEQVKLLEQERKEKFDGILVKPFNEKKLTEVILKTLYPIFEESDQIAEES